MALTVNPTLTSGMRFRCQLAKDMSKSGLENVVNHVLRNFDKSPPRIKGYYLPLKDISIEPLELAEQKRRQSGS